MAKKILEVSGITKLFGKFKAVDNISFNVKEGEIVGLLGPNGAGKTTTLSMILGIIRPTLGNIKVFGLDFTKNREEVLQKMNYSSAYIRAPWRMKVWEHLYVFALLYNVSDSRQRIEEVLTAFDLHHHKNTFAGDLSSGNMARLNLAKAFINNPKLVLLDEPTSSLDPDIADRVRYFIKESRDKFNTTVLITSHNMAEIEELCDRVIFMNHGKIIAEDTPEGLAKKIKYSRVRLLASDEDEVINYCQQHKIPVSMDGRYVLVEVKESNVAGLLNGLAEKGVDYTEISIDKPTLEDFFIQEARNVN